MLESLLLSEPPSPLDSRRSFLPLSSTATVRSAQHRRIVGDSRPGASSGEFDSSFGLFGDQAPTIIYIIYIYNVFLINHTIYTLSYIT